MEDKTMIKKATGIAAILLLILGIAIGIAKADVKKAEFQKQDVHALALKADKGGELLLNNLKDFKLQDYLVEKDLSKNLSTAAVKDSAKLYALLDSKLQEAALLKANDHLGALVLKELSLTKDWNKDALVGV
jgi:hypothetical protein